MYPWLSIKNEARYLGFRIMSLTSFLENQDVKKEFKQEFPKLRVRLKKELVAPPLTNNPQLIGTAFDYSMRFYIKHLNPSAVTNKWVAEKVVAFLIKCNSPLAVSDEKMMKMLDRIGKNGDFDYIKLAKIGLGIIKQARNAQSDYMKSGKISDQLLKSSIMLAQLDPFYRVGKIDKNLGKIDDGDLKDLNQLISVMNPESFKAREICMLNPTFGEASRLVRGADADLVIDDMIIDIKTIRAPILEEEYFHQLIGYYTLYKIGGIDGMPPKNKINRLGIYSSRYGYLHVINIQDIIDENTFPEFLKWFKEKAEEISSKEKIRYL